MKKGEKTSEEKRDEGERDEGEGSIKWKKRKNDD